MAKIQATGDLPTGVLYTDRQPLDALFSPRSVALVGATERTGSVGRTLLRNLITNPFGGTVYPVNPKRRNVLGIRTYPNVAEIPEPVDLAVIATPAPDVPAVIGECVEAGVKGAIIISAGFREVGPSGAELERQILEQARRGRMRLIGPNCLGIMNTQSGLNATFAADMAQPGSLGFVSQSGALCSSVLDWSFRESVGFSAFVSIGSMLDVGWGDLIDHLGNDPRTRAIVLYMESVGDARLFLSAARAVALVKPIIVIKAGRTEAAAKAAASHTGSLAGSDEVLDAAFRRCGVIRVKQISDLFNLSEVLGRQPKPKGPRLTILTNAGGPGVLATDALISSGCELATLSESTIEKLDQILPDHWSHGNPIDVLGDADADRYAKAIDVAIRDPNSDGMLVILTPQDMTEPTQTAEQLRPYAHATSKPILASWMGGASVASGVTILNRAGIPTFDFPDTACDAFSYMWRYSYNLKSLYETPSVFAGLEGETRVRDRASELIEAVRASGRTLMTEAESKELLALYNIPTVPTVVAKSPELAVLAATDLGFPVVLKLHSETITHKTDVGGVCLNLRSEDEVRHAFEAIRDSVRRIAGEEHFLGVTVQPMITLGGYELIVGSGIDPQFGPVLLFGAGGQLVEVFRDRALTLPPLNTTLARRMIEQTKIYTALQGVRGRPPVDLGTLERLLVQFARLVAEQRWVREIDINPLLASESRLLALDARVVLHDRDVEEHELPRMAIRPYPAQFVSPWRSADGLEVTFRPIRPEDEPRIVEFHQTLSEGSVYLRYFQALKLSQRIAHERLTRICFIDYDREMAFVAEGDPTGADQNREIWGVGRLNKIPGTNDGEYALLVTDRYQHRGLGSQLMRRLIEYAREEQIQRLVADILTENTGMRQLSERFGFEIATTDDPNVLRAVKVL